MNQLATISLPRTHALTVNTTTRPQSVLPVPTAPQATVAPQVGFLRAILSALASVAV